MLRKLDSYICNRFFKYFFINLLVITGILWFTKIVKFLELATVKNVSFIDFILLSLLTLFNLVSFLIPLVILIASIFTLYNLYHSKELFIIKSAGLSRIKIIKPFLISFSFILLLNYLLLFYLSPLSERLMSSLSTKLANQFLVSVLEEETFNKVDDNTTIFIDRKDSSGVFGNIVIYSKDKENNDVFINSKEAKLIKHKDKMILGLNQGSRYVVENKQNIKDSLIFGKYLTDLDFFNEDKEIFKPKRKISEYYINELFDKELTKQYKVSKVVSEQQHRIMWPWLGVVLGVMSITILLSGEYNRKGNIAKNIMVIIAALMFILIYFLLKNLISQRINLVFVGYAYIISSLVLLLWLNTINRIKFF